MVKDSRSSLKLFQLSLLFVIGRLIMVVSVPLEGLKSYGDYWNFYNIASTGRPFFDLWVEFPPLFPLLSRGLYLLVGGREHSYIYALVVIFSMFQAGNIFLLQKIATKINPEYRMLNQVLVYSFLLIGLFYGWTYFDSLAVFFLLFGLYLVLNKKAGAAGVAIGIGGLIKWFPLLILPAAWKWLGSKKAFAVIGISLLIIVMGWGLLFGFSPEFTRASLLSQGSKGSWETIWALIDGNYTTGNFAPELKRTIAATAVIPTGNAPVVPTWLTLLIFGGIGLSIFLKAKLDDAAQFIFFTGFTLIIFLLWSPGYSPQWTLYLLPFVFLCFNERRSLLLGLVLVFVNLLEWPILLSRGWFHYLDEIVLLRTALFILLAVLFAQGAIGQREKDKVLR